MGIARGMHLGNHYGCLSRSVGGQVPLIEPDVFWHPSLDAWTARSGAPTSLWKKKFYVHPQGREATSQAGARETDKNKE